MADHRPDEDDDDERGDLEVAGDRVEASARLRRVSVHDRRGPDDGDRNEDLRCRPERDEASQRDGEAERERRDRTGEDGEEGEPPDEEAGHRVIGGTQVDVVAAGAREHRAELGVRERPREGKHSAGEPRRAEPARLRQELRDPAGGEEDTDPDDGGNDEHRRVTERQDAGQLGRFVARLRHRRGPL